MNKLSLPTEVEIDEKICSFNADFRNILDIFNIFNDPDLLESEQFEIALSYFYDDDTYLCNIEEAAKQMVIFLNGGEYDDGSGPQQKPLFDWEQDCDIIIAPINRTVGHDIRSDEFLHWWTFLSAFYEIGECTFSTFVSIRDKLNKGKKLDKAEERLYRENMNRIRLKKRYDSVTQSLMDEIMGKEV